MSSTAVPVAWPEGVAAAVAAAEPSDGPAAAAEPPDGPTAAAEPSDSPTAADGPTAAADGPTVAAAAAVPETQRPKRASALRAGSRIRGVLDWEECDESSAQFVQAAAQIEIVFDEERTALATRRVPGAAGAQAEDPGEADEDEETVCAAAAQADEARAARVARSEAAAAAAAARAARTVISESEEDAESVESTGSADEYSDGSEESSEDGSYESSFVSKSDDSGEDSDEEAPWNPSASHIARARVEARAVLAAKLPVAPAAVDVWTALPAGVDAVQDVFATDAGAGAKRPRADEPSGSGEASPKRTVAPLTAANLDTHARGL